MDIILTGCSGQGDRSTSKGKQEGVRELHGWMDLVKTLSGCLVVGWLLIEIQVS